MFDKPVYHRFSGLILSLLILASLAGCSRNDKGSAQAPAPLKPVPAHDSVAPAAPPSDRGLRFTAPPGWIEEQPSSPMRQAQYKLPRVEGDAEDAEMTVYYFQGGGGGVQANIDRWISQFSKPDGRPVDDEAKVSRRESHGIPLTIVDVSGNYDNSMGPGSQVKPMSEYRLLGAVAEASNGPWFFKLTGPAKTVAKWESSFQSFLDSIQ